MKKPEEIKRGLECCINSADLYNGCNLCPYNEEKFACFEVQVDALAYIQQLERDNAQKDERIRDLERERDALLKIAIKDCFFCKHFPNENADDPCVNCTTRNTLWEWRGVEEDT